MSRATGHQFQVPCTVWRLLPSFKPVQVTLVEARSGMSDYYVDDKGKYHSLKEVFATRADAINAGWARLADEKALLDKRTASLVKRGTALHKAENEPEVQP